MHVSMRVNGPLLARPAAFHAHANMHHTLATVLQLLNRVGPVGAGVGACSVWTG